MNTPRRHHLPPPAKNTMVHADLVNDHLRHRIYHSAIVDEDNRLEVDVSPNGTVELWVTKNDSTQTLTEGIYCPDCARFLDLPNEWEWA